MTDLFVLDIFNIITSFLDGEKHFKTFVQFCFCSKYGTSLLDMKYIHNESILEAAIEKLSGAKKGRNLFSKIKNIFNNSISEQLKTKSLVIFAKRGNYGFSKFFFENNGVILKGLTNDIISKCYFMDTARKTIYHRKILELLLKYLPTDYYELIDNMKKTIQSGNHVLFEIFLKNIDLDCYGVNSLISSAIYNNKPKILDILLEDEKIYFNRKDIITLLEEFEYYKISSVRFNISHLKKIVEKVGKESIEKYPIMKIAETIISTQNVEIVKFLIEDMNFYYSEKDLFLVLRYHSFSTSAEIFKILFEKKKINFESIKKKFIDQLLKIDDLCILVYI